MPITTAKRIQSVDILRGLIMLIMALDHARDFFHKEAMTGDPTNMATTTPFLFFTRWITHFCAPTFLVLSGLSAFLAGLKKTNKEQSVFLLKRGAWLIFAEVAIVTLGLTFNPFYNVIILQVIWAIGFSMLLLGLLIRTSIKTIAIVGFVIVVGHNIFDYVSLTDKGTGLFALNTILNVSHTFIPLGANRGILIFYAAIPWSGLMLLGYAFGQYFTANVESSRRRKILMRTGALVILFFIIVRFINQYGDPSHWSTQKNGVYTFLSFLNVTKYPPSLLYSCMTVGCSIIALSLLENVNTKFTSVLAVYGKVPFFYYVIHFYLIHILCVLLFYASGYGAKDIVDPQQTLFLFRPANFGFSLPVVYGIWFAIITVLYRPCRWFVKYKQTHRQWWLSYV